MSVASMLLLAGTALVVSGLLTALVRRMALSRSILDVPNERSSHFVPTPRGGGAAIVITTTLLVIGLAALDVIASDIAWAIGGGGVAVAIVGFLDDRFSLSARVRLAVHFLTAFWALACAGGLPALQLGESVIDLGWYGVVFGAVGIVWTLNLFNFMDGIDGIAASETAFVACAGAMLACWSGSSSGVVVIGAILAAACCGFLFWNWSPAKIFMGDVGSGYLGYVVAVLPVFEARQTPAALLVWSTLGGVFFVDATVTLLRRLLRRERLHQAHRSHAYQWLSRRWGSHARVTLSVIAINLLWLAPLAFAGAAYPRFAAWLTIGALVPLVLLAVRAGAGLPERV